MSELSGTAVSYQLSAASDRSRQPLFSISAFSPPSRGSCHCGCAPAAAAVQVGSALRTESAAVVAAQRPHRQREIELLAQHLPEVEHLIAVERRRQVLVGHLDLAVAGTRGDRLRHVRQIDVQRQGQPERLQAAAARKLQPRSDGPDEPIAVVVLAQRRRQDDGPDDPEIVRVRPDVVAPRTPGPASVRAPGPPSGQSVSMGGSAQSRITPKNEPPSVAQGRGDSSDSGGLGDWATRDGRPGGRFGDWTRRPPPAPAPVAAPVAQSPSRPVSLL